MGTSNKTSVYIKKHAIYIIHRLAYDPYARGPLGNCTSCPCVKTPLQWYTRPNIENSMIIKFSVKKKLASIS